MKIKSLIRLVFCVRIPHIKSYESVLELLEDKEYTFKCLNDFHGLVITWTVINYN